MNTSCGKKADEITLRPALRWFQIGREQWAGVVANERRALEGDAEALHDLRVALRRFRVWLRVTADMCDEAPLRVLERALRATQKALGPARDADVVLAAWRRWRAGQQERLSGPGEVEARLARKAAASRRIASRRLHGGVWAETKRRVESVLERLEKGERLPQTQIENIGRSAMKKAWKRVKRRYRRLDKMESENVHRLRIAVRKLRYIGEFFVPFVGKPANVLSREAKKWQDALGDIHDLDVVMLGIQRMPETAVRSWRKTLDRRRRKLTKKLDDDQRKFYKSLSDVSEHISSSTFTA